MSMTGKVSVEGYKCERCGHVWVPRLYGKKQPVICPKCKSPYWNKPRQGQGKKK
jgi:predicted Zn-ribbon and HTH transcriptional regulator